jgi:hypothetical protein
MAQARSGGGINSRVVSNVKASKAEPTSYAVTPGRASLIGQSIQGFAKGPIHDGRGYSTPQGPTPNTENLGPGGCGRQVMRSGSQGTHGATTSGIARPGADRPVFPGFPGRR